MSINFLRSRALPPVADDGDPIELVLPAPTPGPGAYRRPGPGGGPDLAGLAIEQRARERRAARGAPVVPGFRAATPTVPAHAGVSGPGPSRSSVAPRQAVADTHEARIQAIARQLSTPVPGAIAAPGSPRRPAATGVPTQRPDTRQVDPERINALLRLTPLGRQVLAERRRLLGQTHRGRALLRDEDLTGLRLRKREGERSCRG